MSVRVRMVPMMAWVVLNKTPGFVTATDNANDVAPKEKGSEEEIRARKRNEIRYSLPIAPL